MLAKPFRFHGHQTVRRVYRQGRPVRGELGSLHILDGPHIITPKVAVVVSKKVSKSAVTRNRIRRRVYELIRVHPEHKKFSSEMVFTVFQAEAATIPAAKLEQEVAELLQKAKQNKPSHKRP